jgi:hypothetical protein
MLESYLQSFQSLKVDNSFKINVKLLSLPNAHSVRDQVGAFDIEKSKRWCFRIPLAAQFANKCLPLAILVGYIKLCEKDKFDMVAKHLICRSKNAEQDSANALLLLFNETRESCKNLALCSYTKLYIIEDTCAILSEYFNIQILVFTKTLESLVMHKVPSTTQFDRPQVFLYRDGDHIDLITNIKTFMASVNARDFCLACHHINKSHARTHRCRDFPSCFSCHSIFETETTFL